MEDITVANYTHSCYVCSKSYIIVSWSIWEISEYVSWNKWNKPSSISYCGKISMTSSLKNNKVKLDLLTGIDMLLMVEKGIRGSICHAAHQ